MGVVVRAVVLVLALALCARCALACGDDDGVDPSGARASATRDASASAADAAHELRDASALEDAGPPAAFEQPCGERVRCASPLICVAAPKQRDGVCRFGGSNEPCYLDAHCLSGICGDAVHSEPGRCRSGEPRDLCADDSECVDGRCVRGETESRCTRGGPGEPCAPNVECTGALLCVALTDGPAGTCGEGSVGALCARDDHCRAGRCVLLLPTVGHCSDGSPRSPCATASDCGSGRCSRPMQSVPALGACE